MHRFHTQRQAEVCPDIPPVPGTVSGHRGDVLKNSLDRKALLVVASLTGRSSLFVSEF